MLPKLSAAPTLSFSKTLNNPFITNLANYLTLFSP
ncbi:hypothetical protein SVI_4117 [Shewanella violacea DSS12]|uniref:Uncharacterized protein n=1 Tax=Shewanella violacea (strain JCM 10179 / CIP 106290 / LMG 19151 / DSS12) TaxID=637905 RepID=D4ZE27_SHEVD|nr:hypothetical protein SVI_4117 [Shewanella violacea DSS12]